MPDRRAPTDPTPTQSIPQSALERALRKAFSLILLLALVLYFGTAAITLLLRYAVLPNIDALRPRIEAAASQALHAPVHIGKLSARWQSTAPEITVSELSVQDDNGHNALRIDHAEAVVSWRSLLRLQPILSSLTIDGADMVASRREDGKISIAGVTLGVRKSDPFAFSNWLLSQQAVILRHAAVHWRDDLRGAPELTLRDVRLAVLNEGRSHRLGLQATFDDPALGNLDVRANFRHRLFSGLLDSPIVRPFGDQANERGNPVNWSGEAYLSTRSLDLPSLSRYLDLPIAAYGGRMRLNDWVSFNDGQIESVSGDLGGEGLLLRVNPKLPALGMPRVALKFAASRKDGIYTTSIRDLSLELADQSTLDDGTPVGRLLDIGRFDGSYQRPEVGRGERISLAGDVLDIGLLADFTRALPLPLRLKRNLDLIDPRGVIAQYDMFWERQSPANPAAASAARVEGNQPLLRYRMHAQLDGVSVAAQAPRPGLNAAGHPHIGRPGFHNIRGQIDADETGGHLVLASPHSSVTIRGMFDEPTLAFDTLEGEANWKIATDAAASPVSGPAPSSSANDDQDGGNDAASRSSAASTSGGAGDRDGDGSAQTSSDIPGEPVRYIDAHIPSLRFSNADMRGTVEARFRTASNAAPMGRLDLSARLDHAAVPRVPRYLPTSIGPLVRAELGHALLAGTANDVTIEAHGRLPDLPYPHGPATPDAPHQSSEFHISAPFTDGKLNLSPYPAIHLANGEEERWPLLDGVVGRFFMDGRTLGFDVSGGRYKNVRLSSATGRIDDLADFSRDFEVRGNANGPLADLISFAKDSPLAFWSGHTVDHLSADGNAALALHLSIPRHRAPTAVAAVSAASAAAVAAAARSSTHAPRSKVRVAGTLTFGGNRLAFDKLPPLTALTGQVGFTEHTAALTGLQGQLLGGDFRADGGLQADGSVDLSVDGRISPRASFDTESAPVAALLQRLSGTAPYKVAIHRTQHNAPELSLRSDLTGLGIDLPAPLGKAEGTAMPLSVDWRTLATSDGAAAGAMDVDAAAGRDKTAEADKGTDRGTDKGTTANAAGRPASAWSGLRAWMPGKPARTARTAVAHSPDTPSAPSTPPLQRIDLMAGPVRASYLRRGGDNPGVVAGAIDIGASASALANRAPTLPEHGVVASMNVASFDADAWRAAVSSIMRHPTGDHAESAGAGGGIGTNTGNTVGNAVNSDADGNADDDAGTHPGVDAGNKRRMAEWLPDRYHVDVQDLTLFSRHWTDLIGNGTTNAMHGWEARVDGTQLAGNVEWQPQGGSAIHARLSKLIVPAADPVLVAQAKQAAANAPAPSQKTPSKPISHYPAIDLVADRFVVDKRDFGKLEVLAHNIEAGETPVWALDKLELSNDAARLSASGDWRTAARAPGTVDGSDGNDSSASPEFHTALDFKLAIHDGGALLDRLGLPKTLRGGTGSLGGSVNWRGSPGSIDTHTLQGALVLDLHKGQILKVDPGVARLLGVVSLQGLARFLQLDFKGIFGEGLAFDKLTGSASITHGIVETHDFDLETTPARVTMGGSADIPAERQDLLVTVVPHLNAGSASIAAAVVNPLLGLGSLLAQLALADPIARSLTRHYRITGPWAKPVIQRTDANRGNMPLSAEHGKNRP